MPIESLLLFIVAANLLSSSDVKPIASNLLLFSLSLFLGFEWEVTFVLLDGTSPVQGHMYGSIILETSKGVVKITKNDTPGNVVQIVKNYRFVHVDKKNDIIRMYMSLKHMSPSDVKVYIDGYLTQWDPSTKSFFLDHTTDDLTPRTDNLSSTNSDQGPGISFEVRTGGVPLKHLKYL